MKKCTLLALSLFLVLGSIKGFAQEKTKSIWDEKTFEGLKFRSVGPAFMSGRLSDIAIDPMNENIWYAAVSSGGLWKTVNAGTTWKPLTDKESFYATGCVTIDPNNSGVIWLGTGENNGGRHIGVGHGVFKSTDGGDSWKNMGLKKSEHISKIIVHPDDSDVVWLASQGPLWSSGGDRGLYKTTDGGKTWNQTLKVNEWTGVTDLVIDPRDPNILYAASWQRHRNVAAYMGGGPGTALYKSTDGGETWNKLETGLPKGDMGKIGLAISPMQPDVLYAAIELERRKGAVYRSTDQGGSWTKMSDTVSGGTGPHYYQELIASPHVFDRLYLMNNNALISEDGGKTFVGMKEDEKHGDNHSLAFKANDPNYLLMGSDGGIYESFDHSETWKYVSNLPVTQFYKVAVDDAEPFYNIFGGTQDNNTEGGPSRTLNSRRIANQDWFVLLGGDGHQPATTPGNPDIVYAQSQQGNLHRVDRTTGEAVFSKPYSKPGEEYERFNWDSPILVSNHDPKRLYFASQRVWRSDDRGDSWTPISKDLTKNQERLTLPIMGKRQSWDAVWDVYAMSTYNTITSLSESPIDENIIFAGTDDGHIQYTTTGGENWTNINVNALPGVPSTAFVNDIKADLHDSNIAYVALDNHKFGDYNPYLFKTVNGGKTWSAINNGLPKGTLTWRLVQDHVNKNLLFLATEYGIYVSFNQGTKWIKFSNGLPTISFRDLAIQKRENDLIGASFGRSFYVFDDYSPLREVSEEMLRKEGMLFKPRKALQYTPVRGGSRSQGGDFFWADNPPYGAVFKYYLSDADKSMADSRKEKEKDLKKAKKDIPFPGWDALENEKNQTKPTAILVVKNAANEVVARINGPLKKGFQQVSWDLTQSMQTVLTTAAEREGRRRFRRAIMVDPGSYTVSLYKSVDGVATQLGNPQTFKVERIRKNVLTNPNADKIADYAQDLKEFSTKYGVTMNDFNKASKKVKAFTKALKYVSATPGTLENEVVKLQRTMHTLNVVLFGNSAKAEVGEKDDPTVGDRLMIAQRGFFGNSYGPTKMQMESLQLAKKQFSGIMPELFKFLETDVPRVEKLLQDAGAPPIVD
ncbi:MAG: glycosyl hydrolase [Maribacter sp.]|nr:glycosyl hydrolase [Maribacter sp.]